MHPAVLDLTAVLSQTCTSRYWWLSGFRTTAHSGVADERGAAPFPPGVRPCLRPNRCLLLGRAAWRPQHAPTRANACVERADTGIGLRRIALAAGDKIMAGRQLRTLRSLAEAV